MLSRPSPTPGASACDALSLKSSESSVFDLSPQSPEQWLIRKSVEEEGLLAFSVERPNQSKNGPRHVDILDTKGCATKICSVPATSGNFNPISQISGSLQATVQGIRRFPKLPSLPSTKQKKEPSLAPTIPQFWDSYPDNSTRSITDNQEDLELTNGHSLSVDTNPRLNEIRLEKRILVKKRLLKIKIYIANSNEALVVRRDNNSPSTMSELLRTIIRKIESIFNISPEAVKLFLLFSNRNRHPVELLKDRSSSCLYTSFIMEYIHGRDKIAVLAKIA